MSHISAQPNTQSQQNIVIIQGKQYQIHIVKRGETMFGIAKKYDVPYDTLLHHNPFIVPSSLEVGETIKIPVYKKEKPSEPTPYRYHEVKSGETLYRIAINYGTTVETLTELNPEASQGLHPGQKLRIPSESPKIPEKQVNNIYILYTVESDETIDVIARKFEISTQEMAEANPGINLKRLKKGMVLQIPQKEKKSQSQLPDSLDKYYQTRKVLPKETLYSIAKQYQTDVETLKKINPFLQSRELQAGEIIRVPKGNITATASGVEPETTRESVRSENQHCPCTPAPKPTYKIGIMLPFYANLLNDSIQVVPARSKQFIEFYQGALLAINDLKAKGLNAEIYVFDTQNNIEKTKSICKSQQFKTLDLIIGPIFGKNIELVAQEAKMYKIPVVSPLSTEENFLEGNPYSFMVSPSQKTLEEALVNYVSSIRLRNLVIIYDGLSQDSAYIPSLKRKLFSKYDPNDIHSLRYTEFAYFKGQETKLLDIFTSSDTTLVLVPSNDEAFVSDLIGRLNSLSKDRVLIVVGQPRWAKFENIKLEFFHNLNTRIFSISNQDFTNKNVVNFIKQYRTYFLTEPTQRAYEGYDITKYFSEALFTYGKDFRCCLKSFNPELLQMKFNFKSDNANHGQINQHLFLVEYTPDWRRIFSSLGGLQE